MTTDLVTPDPAEAPEGGVGDIIETRALSKSYGKTAALSGVDLKVPSGAVYMLAGQNGAGKTTLVRTLLNLERSTAQVLRVAGLDPRRRGAAVRAQVGYVPERFDIGAPWLTIENWFAERAIYYPAWDHAYVETLCRRLEIDVASRIGHLSKGQARRVQLAAALAFRPPLLLLDEPTDGLDPVARDAFLGQLSDHLADTGCTVLVSTHLIYEFDALVDHVGVLSAGRLAVQASRDDLQRTVRRYRTAGPDGWEGPADLPGVLRRERFGREIHWIVRGDEAEARAAITTSGGEVRDAAPLNLHDAIVNLMREKSPS